MSRRTLAVLTLLCVAQVAANSWWLAADEGVQFTDAAYHYSQIIDLRNAVLEGSEGVGSLLHHDERQRYGSLGYLVAAGVSLLTGPEASSILLGLSFLLWPLLLLGSYRLGWLLAPPNLAEQTGLLSAALVGLIPGVFNYSRTLVLDLPLTAAVLWGVVLMLHLHHTSGENPQRRRLRWLVGLACFGALSLKVNALAFILGPALALLWPTLRRVGRTDRTRAIRWGSVAVLGAVGLGAWLLFGRRGPALRATLSEATWPGTFFSYLREGTISEFPAHYFSAVWDLSWEMTYYTVLQSLTPLLAVPALLAYLWYFGRRRGCEDPVARGQRAAMFGWMFLPIFGLLFGLRGLYDERYLLPLLPQVAALMAVAIAELPSRRTAVSLAGALLLAGTLNFGIISFDILPSARPLACLTLKGWTATDRVDASLWTCAAYPNYRFMDRPTRPDRQDWGHERIEDILKGERERLGRPLRAVFLDDLYDLFYRAFQRDLLGGGLYRHEDMLLVTRCWDEEWMRAVWGSTQALRATIAEADVLLMRYGSPEQPGDTALRGRRCTVFDARRFSLERELPLLDGTRLRIYFRNP
jgi:hypothetical protein